MSGSPVFGSVVLVIVEFFMSLGGQIFAWASQNMSSSTDLDGVIVKSGTAIVPIIQGIGSMGVWIPWQVIGLCMGALFPLYLGAFLFKVARAIAAHLPLIGGAG